MATQDDPKRVFSQNLQRLATNLGMGCDELANAIKLVGEDKKWLWRLWEHGIRRTNRKTQNRLERLARFLGLSSAAEFWNVRCESNPRVLLDFNVKSWVEMIGHAVELFRAVPYLWARYPKEFGQIVEKHNMDEVRIIAYFLACKYGRANPEEPELKTLKHMLEETQAERDFELSLTFVEQVQERAKQHPAWNVFYKSLEYKCQEEGAVYRSVDDEIDKRIRKEWSALPTPEEVHRRFVEHYLNPLIDGHSPADGADDDYLKRGLDQILLQLQVHPKWRTHLDQKFDGDGLIAKQQIKEFWERYYRDTTGTASPDDFTFYYIKRVLS